MNPQHCTVLGCAPMAVSVALALHRKGIPVRIVEPDAYAIERMLHAMHNNRDALATLIDRDFPDRIEGVLILSEAELEQDDLLLASSRLSAEAAVLNLGSAARTARVFSSSQCAGLHLFEPVNLRRLAEIEPLSETLPSVTEAARRLVGYLDKEPLILAPGNGSAALRLLDRMLEAADTLMMDGSTPWDIDEAMVAYGFDMGVYEAQDLAGLDVAYSRRQATAAQRNPARRYIPIADRAVNEGRLGKKIGWGWYRYPGGGGAVIDPLVEDLAREEAWFAGVTPDHIEDAELIRRLELALINEGGHLISEGILGGWAEVDAIAVHALGFPERKGGLGKIVQDMGPSQVLAQLQALSREDPVVWEPAPLFRSAQTEG